MTLVRTMYVLLLVGLAFYAVSMALVMIDQIGPVFAQIISAPSAGSLMLASSTLFMAARVLVAVAALYWIPKAVKRFFPEVS